MGGWGTGAPGVIFLIVKVGVTQGFWTPAPLPFLFHWKGSLFLQGSGVPSAS